MLCRELDGAAELSYLPPLELLRLRDLDRLGSSLFLFGLSPPSGVDLAMWISLGLMPLSPLDPGLSRPSSGETSSQSDPAPGS